MIQLQLQAFIDFRLSAYTGKAAGAAGDGQDGGGRMVISRPFVYITNITNVIYIVE